MSHKSMNFYFLPSARSPTEIRDTEIAIIKILLYFHEICFDFY